MKVLLINTTNKFGSTGKTCSEIQKYLIQQGDECSIAHTDLAADQEPNNSFYFGNHFGSQIHSVMAHVIGREGYYSSFSTKKLLHYISEYQPDIVHLFVLHSHILNLNMLFGYLNSHNIPIVINLDDCWWFTGKCMYFSQHNCNRFETECCHCPAKHDSPNSFLFDYSKQMQLDKKKWLSKNVTTISVSMWIRDCAERSFVLKGHKNEMVYNWIDSSIFHQNLNAMKKNQIKVIACVSYQWVDSSDKYQRLQEFAQLIDPKKELLKVAGECEHPFVKEGVQFLGRLNNQNELAQLYQSADVYVHMSDRDTFGKVVAEAMACGTPCVVLNRTALPELVTEECGKVCTLQSAEDLYRNTEVILETGKEHYSKTCAERASSLFDMNHNIGCILQIYHGVLNENLK